MTQQRPDLPLADRRIHERHTITLHGTVTVGGEPVSVRLRNLSYGGALVAFPLAVRTFRGHEVTLLDIPDVARMSCALRWSSDHLAGVEFRHPERYYGALRAFFLQMGLER